jgi:hypothetical protein
VAPQFKYSLIISTRRNDYKIETGRCRYDVCKYFFTNRVIGIWNSLPNDIITASTTNRLDKFWQDQELVYNYKSEISGIGSRSSKF